MSALWQRLFAWVSRDRTGDELWRARIVLVVAMALSASTLPGVVLGLLEGTLFGPLAGLVLSSLYAGVVWRLGQAEGLEPAANQLVYVLMAGCTLFMLEQPVAAAYSGVMLVAPTAAYVLGPIAGWRWLGIQAAVTLVFSLCFGEPGLRDAMMLVVTQGIVAGTVLMAMLTMVLDVVATRAEQLVQAEEKAAAAHADAVAERNRVESLTATLAEEKMRLAAVVEHLPHAVYWRDPDGTLAGWNGTFDALARDGARRLTVDGECPLAERDQEVVLAGEVDLDCSETWLVADEPVPVEVSRVPLPLDHGEGLLVIVQDVSARRDLEAELATARRLEAVGRLAAGIAHEINTPAQYVGDNLEFLQQTFDDLAGPLGCFVAAADEPERATRELLEALEEMDYGYLAEELPRAFAESAEGMGRVKEIVLGMKRFSHRSSTPILADLNQAIEATIVVTRNEWKYFAQVDTRLDPELGDVFCVEGEIKQVLLNLVVNAAHAIAARDESRDEPGLIYIESESLGDEVALRVTDNGSGMSDEVKQRVFEPFFTTKPVGQGSGQGLALVHSVVVNDHGGRISVKSREGEGTTFEVVLPRERQAKAVEPVPA